MLIAQTICTQGNRVCRLQEALQFPSGNTLEADENDPPATLKTKKKSSTRASNTIMELSGRAQCQ
jgi:hypothetical protein